MKLTFLGGAGTVTGSRYLLDIDGQRILVDCGLFQGLKELRERNWAKFPVPPESIDAVILTHAHIDHTGYLPLLIRDGFSGPVYSTSATRDLCAILLPDSGHLQEKDAELANRNGFSKHKPALPLYTLKDAERAMDSFRPLVFDAFHKVIPGLSFRFSHAGHILGAAILEVEHRGRRLVFSGDLGRPGSPTMPDPTPIREADYLLVESTYGDRKHDGRDAEAELSAIVRRVAGRGGTVVIPAFAVGRTQALLYHFHRLRERGEIDVPIYLDSPMAIDVSDLFRSHPTDHSLTATEWRAICQAARATPTVEESKELDRDESPKIIISASGMATGGRVLHHLKRYVTDPAHAIVFAGYQAPGTRGAAMLDGVKEIKIHGEQYEVRAEIKYLPMLSAHADSDELIGWLRHFEAAPRRTFITHGEPAAANALRQRIKEELGWPAEVPAYMEVAELN